MTAFEYTARTRGGDKTAGTITAADLRAARRQIQRLGYVPITVSEKGIGSSAKADNKNKGKGKNGKANAPAKSSRSRPNTKKGGQKEEAGKITLGKKTAEGRTALGGRKKMKMREILDFSLNLRDLTTSGMTIGQALNSLSKRTTGTYRDVVLEDLRENINQGMSLSDALNRHPDTFSQFYSSMVRAGEASGQLPSSLDNIITHYERMEKAKSSVIGALVYPVIVLFIGVAAVIFLLLVVVPQFVTVFEDLDMELPVPTKMLIGLSKFVGSLYGLILLAVIVLAFMMFMAYIKSEHGQFKWHGFLLRVPVIKGIIANNAFAQFSRTLGGLLKNGVPVLTAMKITEKSSTNRVVQAEAAHATDRIADGAPLSKTLENGGVFPQMFTDMLSVGEQSGDVPRALDNIAKRYDADLERSLGTFTKLLEPIFMLAIAFVVGFVAIAMLMAVFKMSSGLGG